MLRARTELSTFVILSAAFLRFEGTNSFRINNIFLNRELDQTMLTQRLVDRQRFSMLAVKILMCSRGHGGVRKAGHVERTCFSALRRLIKNAAACYTVFLFL